jgi:hypothetical protein
VGPRVDAVISLWEMLRAPFTLPFAYFRLLLEFQDQPISDFVNRALRPSDLGGKLLGGDPRCLFIKHLIGYPVPDGAFVRAQKRL